VIRSIYSSELFLVITSFHFSEFWNYLLAQSFGSLVFWFSFGPLVWLLLLMLEKGC
jgi:hypothetical protein